MTVKKLLKTLLSFGGFHPDIAAGSYIQYLHFWRELKQLPTHRFKRILDAGFGPAHYASEVARRFPSAEVVGYDMHLPATNGRPDNLSLHQKDLRTVDDRDRFDFIYSIEVLEHIPGNPAVLKGLYQALRPRGILYLHMPCEKLSRWILPERWFRRYREWARGEHIGEQYTVDELRALLLASGFEVLKVEWTFGHFGELLDEVDELVRQTFPRIFRYLRMIYGPVMKSLCRLAVVLPKRWGNVMAVARKPACAPLPDNPLVSVIITTYNSAHLVSRAIESVLSQTYPNLEILVIDEASKDNIEEVAGRFTDPRVQLRRYVDNSGLPGARNRGIAQAKGSLIAFLDADDAWRADKVERQVQVLRENPSVGVVYCGIEYRRDNETLGYRTPGHRGDILSALLGEHVVGNATTYLIRKECFGRVGLFDETLRTYGEDWDLMLRLAKEYDFDFVAEPLAQYYFHNQHKSGELIDRPLKSMGDRLIIIERNKTEYDMHPRARALVMRRIGVDFCKAGRTAEARAYLMRSAAAWPYSPRMWVALAASFLGPKLFYQAWFWFCVFRKRIHTVALIRSIGKKPVIESVAREKPRVSG